MDADRLSSDSDEALQYLLEKRPVAKRSKFSSFISRHGLCLQALLFTLSMTVLSLSFLFNGKDDRACAAQISSYCMCMKLDFDSQLTIVSSNGI
jgi:hypothetical protein